MTRMIVTLEERDKAWLRRYSQAHRQSMAETVRRAIRSYRSRVAAQTDRRVLRETAGLWRGRATDGMDYQRNLRGEWSGR